MSNCIEADLISAYIDKELAAQEISSLELHLEGCRACREELRDLRDVAAITAGAAPLHAPADLTAALVAQAFHARQDLAERRRTQLPMWVGGLAAAATLVIWVGVHETAAPANIPIDALLAAHSRQVSGTLHDNVQAAAVYSEALKRAAEANARS